MLSIYFVIIHCAMWSLSISSWWESRQAGFRRKPTRLPPAATPFPRLQVQPARPHVLRPEEQPTVRRTTTVRRCRALSLSTRARSRRQSYVVPDQASVPLHLQMPLWCRTRAASQLAVRHRNFYRPLRLLQPSWHQTKKCRHLQRLRPQSHQSASHLPASQHLRKHQPVCRQPGNRQPANHDCC